MQNLSHQTIEMKRILRGVLIAGMLVSMSAYSAEGLKILAEKYPLSITADASNEDAEIRITGALYEWNNSTESFTSKVDELINSGVKNVKVYINSPGGDVFVGAEIINQLKRFSGSKIGFGGAIVASAATLIAIELDGFEMSQNGQWMWHKPSGMLHGNEDKIESSLTLLKNLTTQYRAQYALKTGKTEEEIEALWSKGDVWLTAQQAKDFGFITSVSESAKINKTTAEMITAFGGKKPAITDNKKDTMNRNAIISALKLSADATDEQIEAAIAANANKASQVDQLTAAAQEAQKQNIDKLLDQAIVDKKITADQKETYRALATANYDETVKAIDAMRGVEKPTVTPGSADTAKTDNWTMEDWAAKDPEGLKKLMVDNPSAYAKLENEYFKNV